MKFNFANDLTTNITFWDRNSAVRHLQLQILWLDPIYVNFLWKTALAFSKEIHFLKISLICYFSLYFYSFILNKIKELIKYDQLTYLKITTTNLTSFQSLVDEYLSGTTRCLFILPILAFLCGMKTRGSNSLFSFCLRDFPILYLRLKSLESSYHFRFF